MPHSLDDSILRALARAPLCRMENGIVDLGNNYKELNHPRCPSLLITPKSRGESSPRADIALTVIYAMFWIDPDFKLTSASRGDRE